MSDMITIDTGTGITESLNIKFHPYNIVSENDPILKEVIPEFDFNSDVDVKELCGRMQKTLESAKGFGLAAPQCGLRYRMFIIGAEGNYNFMFNPKIIDVSEIVTHMPEGCLSFPFLVLSISRPEEIVVEYQDKNGNTLTEKFVGLTARIIQHEIDHLNGVTFDTITKPLALKTALKRREKKTAKYAKSMMSYRKLLNA